MCFVNRFMIVSRLGVKYFPTKKVMKVYAKELQEKQIVYTAYEWNEARSYYSRIGGSICVT